MLHFETIDPSTLELLTHLQKIKGLNRSRLVGGTGLSLQMGHRKSVDLDFFAYELKEVKSLESEKLTVKRLER